MPTPFSLASLSLSFYGVAAGMYVVRGLGGGNRGEAGKKQV